MATEIERKWLLSLDARRHLMMTRLSPDMITQGYICTGDTEVRIRLLQRVIGEDQYTLGVKNGHGIARTEIEVPVDAMASAALLSIAQFAIRKLRHRIDRWEINVFLNELDGLTLMEIELTEETEALPEFPADLKNFIVREVTYDRRYENQNLAQTGIPNDAEPAHMAEGL